MAASPINPIISLETAIAKARQIPAAPEYSPPSDPLATLLKRISSAPEETPSSSGSDASPASRNVVPQSLEATLGKEVLNLVSNRPLSAQARADAVRSAIVAIENPTPDNVRAILAALLKE